MPKYNFDFEIVTDSEGILHYEKRLNIPISVKLKGIRMQTEDGYQQRSHVTTVLVNGEVWAEDEQIIDCQPFDFSKTIKVDAGGLSLLVKSDGFEPAETVRGRGWIEYGLALF